VQILQARCSAGRAYSQYVKTWPTPGRLACGKSGLGAVERTEIVPAATALIRDARPAKVWDRKKMKGALSNSVTD
jgi:hypothetical protein